MDEGHKLPRVPDLWKAVLALAFCTGSIDLLHIYFSYRLGFEELNWAQNARVFIVWWSTYTIVLVTALFLARRFPLVPEFRTWRFALHFLAAAGLAYIHTGSNALLYPPTFYPGMDRLHLSIHLARMNFPIDFVSYWTIVGVTYAFHFYASAQERRLAEAHLRTKTEQLQRNLVESRLNALRSQLNPHFLFNTLNVVSTLVLKGDAILANRIISRLSTLLRLCLNDKRPQLVPLASELDLLNNYLEIQQLMLGDRLVFQQNIAPATYDAYVPSMLLQPIVENSVVHGIANQTDGGRIAIETARDDQFLRITVADTGPGFSYGPAERPGIGLSNTSARLKQLYGNSYKLTLGQAPEGGALITIRIPFHTADNREEGLRGSEI
ncbi:MAG: histidine kinase [Acidobacteriia bacterium]|nr:histidine kinase [Terriglobia bacterium]